MLNQIERTTEIIKRMTNGETIKLEAHGLELGMDKDLNIGFLAGTELVIQMITLRDLNKLLNENNIMICRADGCDNPAETGELCDDCKSLMLENDCY